jgi:hypothetical protein
MAIRTPISKIAPAGDAYRISLMSGLITVLNAADPIFSLRWTSATHRMIIQELTMNFDLTTAFGGAQDVAWGAYVARTFTASDSGGTATTLTGDNGKLDTTFSTTRVADMRISTTLALTAGTRTLDTQPFLISCGISGNAVGNNMPNPRFMIGVQNADNPITIRLNEGIIIAPLITMGAAGVGHFFVQIGWTEVPLGVI